MFRYFQCVEFFNTFYEEQSNKNIKKGKYIDLFFTGDGIGINVVRDTLVENILEELKEYFNITIDDNLIISNNQKVSENYKIYIFRNNDFNYILSVNHNMFILSQMFLLEDIKQQIIISSLTESDGYKIIERITDLTNNNYSEDFYDQYEKGTMDKIFALDISRELLNSLLKCNFIVENKLRAEVRGIFDRLALMSNEDYKPTISDGILTLSSRFKDYKKDDVAGNFKIVLDETKETVGEIDFELGEEFKYSGNVSYAIREQFRENHFATKALKLLVKLVDNNESDVDKSLFIAVKQDNVASQKVALNNGATLIYDGDVPKDDSLYYIDGIKQVKVYKIDRFDKGKV